MFQGPSRQWHTKGRALEDAREPPPPVPLPSLTPRVPPRPGPDRRSLMEQRIAAALSAAAKLQLPPDVHVGPRPPSP